MLKSTGKGKGRNEKVNEVSRLAGVSKRTLQFYDDEGLLPAQRSKDNYRLYDDAALERLWEILVYRAMGLDLKEIKYLLTLSEKQQKQYLEKKIRGLRQQIRQLNGQMEFISYVQQNGMLPVPTEKNTEEKTYMDYIAVLRKMKQDQKGRTKRNEKRLMMVMCCGIMILGNLSGCNAMKTKETEYHWPTSTLVKSLPVPESKYGEIVLDAEDSFEIDVFNTSKSQFADYINACKENGFNVDYYGTEDSYDAENKDGYTLSLSYDKRKKTMNIDIYDLDDDTEDTQEPEETEEPEETDDSENAKDTSKDSSKTDKKEKKKTSSKKKDGAVDADFKKMMDSYEDFFDEYIEFMKKYENSDDVAGMLNDYADYMTKYADYMQKLNDVDTDNLSTADAAYYTKVQARIVKKLAEIQ